MGIECIARSVHDLAMVQEREKQAKALTDCPNYRKMFRQRSIGRNGGIAMAHGNFLWMQRCSTVNDCMDNDIYVGGHVHKGLFV